MTQFLAIVHGEGIKGSWYAPLFVSAADEAEARGLVSIGALAAISAAPVRSASSVRHRPSRRSRHRYRRR
jgi:hypothetical protein